MSLKTCGERRTPLARNGPAARRRAILISAPRPTPWDRTLGLTIPMATIARWPMRSTEFAANVGRGVADQAVASALFALIA